MSVMLLDTKRERVLLRNSYRLQILIVSNIARIAKAVSHKSSVKPSINVSTVLPVPSCPVPTTITTMFTTLTMTNMTIMTNMTTMTNMTMATMRNLEVI